MVLWSRLFGFLGLLLALLLNLLIWTVIQQFYLPNQIESLYGSVVHRGH